MSINTNESLSMLRGGRHDTSANASFLLGTGPVGSAKLVPESDTLTQLSQHKNRSRQRWDRAMYKGGRGNTYLFFPS